MARVHIESDGHPRSTRVTDVETGQMIRGIQRIDVHLDVNEPRVTADIYQVDLSLGMETQATFHTGSPARRGLAMLLMAYPETEVVRVVRNDRSAWTEVDLREPVLPRRSILYFAIWNHTGNVYRCDVSGAVEDDPFLVVTPFDD